MGGHAYYYVVPYRPEGELRLHGIEEDREACVEIALQGLRIREFSAGRYNPVTPFPNFPVDPNSPGTGAGHASIEEALEDSESDGTRSILDLRGISASPEYFAACPLGDETLLRLYGTTEPSEAMVLEDSDLFEEIERGQGVYVILYESGKPVGIYFAGYSFD
jgi:hypothetical protein